MSELGKELKAWLARADLDIKTDWGRINLLLGGSMANGAENLMKGRDVPFVVRHAVHELVACAGIDEVLRLRCNQTLERKFAHSNHFYGVFGTAPDGGDLAVWKARVRRDVRRRYGLPAVNSEDQIIHGEELTSGDGCVPSANARRRRRSMKMEAA
jgi:hypothetical protein